MPKVEFLHRARVRKQVEAKGRREKVVRAERPWLGPRVSTDP